MLQTRYSSRGECPDLGVSARRGATASPASPTWILARLPNLGRPAVAAWRRRGRIGCHQHYTPDGPLRAWRAGPRSGQSRWPTKRAIPPPQTEATRSLPYMPCLAMPMLRLERRSERPERRRRRGRRREGRPTARRARLVDGMIGHGKAFDTDEYFVICSNVLGAARGSARPSDDRSAGPGGRMARCFRPWSRTWSTLNGSCCATCASSGCWPSPGGSLGGNQALQWAVAYPELVQGCIPIATSAALTAQGIAFNQIGAPGDRSRPRLA